MNVHDALGVLSLLQAIIPEVKNITRMYGFIHRQAPAEINGVKGFLIWDYIIYNEITFKDINDNIYSLFNSVSDDKTEKQWNEFVKKFGV